MNSDEKYIGYDPPDGSIKFLRAMLGRLEDSLSPEEFRRWRDGDWETQTRKATPKRKRIPHRSASRR